MEDEQALHEGIRKALTRQGLLDEAVSSKAVQARDKAVKAAMLEIKKHANQTGKTLTPTMVRQMEAFIASAVSSAMAYYGMA